MTREGARDQAAGFLAASIALRYLSGFLLKDLTQPLQQKRMSWPW